MNSQGLFDLIKYKYNTTGIKPEVIIMNDDELEIFYNLERLSTTAVDLSRENKRFMGIRMIGSKDLKRSEIKIY